jgi:hypothetical protein
MRQGDTFLSSSHGRLVFDRYDEYYGEVTAEFRMLDYGLRKLWLKMDKLDALRRIWP